MQKQAKLNAAIDKGLAYLARQQQADGGFISFSSANMQPFRRIRSWQTTFVPALMLTALAGTDTPPAGKVRGGLAQFLLGQKSPNGSFNYWSKQAPEYTDMPYPDDLDDTFCALAGLFLHDQKLISQEMLAQAIKLLLATETQTGGPYRTWLVPPNSEKIWLDVDVAVNSNIAYFLSLVSDGVPNLDRFMEEAIANNAFRSPYYPTIYPFLYYFARAYRGAHRPRLLKKIQKLHTPKLSALDTALCISARLRLEDTAPMTPFIEQLLAEQRRDGSWPAAAFYADPEIKGKLYYNGAAALTTAMVIEALSLYKNMAAPHTTATRNKPGDRAAGILELAENQSHHLEEDLRKTTLVSLKKLASGSNSTEIIELPERFNRSLREPYVSYGKDFFQRLGLANLYGWLAYTIYDDFLDGEGRPELLSTANVALRESLHNFCKAVTVESFTALVYETFDTIDSANAWELAHCRCHIEQQSIIIKYVPDYGDLTKLAERSLGHTLAPLAILAAKSLTPGDPAFRQVQAALLHYLMVRQLNDDIHDWQDDLENGHISYVVARILKDMHIRSGDHALAGLLAKSQQQFWYHTLPALCEEMQQHIALGRDALQSSGLFKTKNVIAGLLDNLESSISDTLKRQQETAGFLRHYKKKVAQAKL